MKAVGVWLFGLWASAALVGGAVLTSFHEPFRSPTAGVLRLARGNGGHQWRAVHFVSRSCGCSQRVMVHLARRGPTAGMLEEVVAIDGPEPVLAGSLELLARLSSEGYLVQHVEATAIPADARLGGVPLLVVASPEGRVVYTGGYGASSDGDVETIQLARQGERPSEKPVLGCAVGDKLRKQTDPLGWKY